MAFAMVSNIFNGIYVYVVPESKKGITGKPKSAYVKPKSTSPNVMPKTFIPNCPAFELYWTVIVEAPF